MAVIRPGDLPRFLKSGWRETPLILIHGPDEGGIRARAGQIAQAVLGPEPDPMNRVELDADTLAADPARLLDEANSISMFGGRRLILVPGAARLAKSAWQPLLAVPPLDSTVILVADELAKTSPLRVAFEQAALAAVIICYPPTRQDVLALVDQRAAEAGLSVTPVARAALGDLLGTDQALAEGEIDKLLIYCHGRLSIEAEDVLELITDSTELAGTEPIDRAFEGRLEEIEAVALRSFREGINPSGLLALALNHALMLRRLTLARRDGGLDAALRQERVFFRRLDRVRGQAQSWDVARITRAIDLLAAAQDQARRTASLEETIAIRALWSIALASRRR
jgi:DNA polymerase-3 subunit delta